jgi:hypothetical protein
MCRRLSTLVVLFLVVPFFSIVAHAQWMRTSGPADTSIMCLAVHGANLFAGTSNGVYRTTDNGDRWTRVSSGILEPYIKSIVTMDADIFIATIGNKGFSAVYRSTNEGESWYAVTDTFPSRRSASIIQCMYVRDTILFVGAECGGVYRSTDRGNHWEAIDTGIMSPAQLKATAISGTEKNLFVKTDIGECSFTAPTKVFRSTSNGTDWIASDSIDRLDLGEFDFSFGTLGTLCFAAGSNHHTIYRWNDSTTQWEVTGKVGEGASGSTLASAGTNLFAAASDNSSYAVFLSKDSAKSWESVTAGLENVTIYSNPWQLVANDRYLFAGIIEKGVWRRSLSEMVGQSDVSTNVQIKPSFKIYPNPATESTTISITPESSGYVDISIVNLLGAQVAHIFSGELDAREHTFTWDAARMAAPREMYECVVRIGGRVETLPMAVE